MRQHPVPGCVELEDLLPVPVVPFGRGAADWLRQGGTVALLLLFEVVPVRASVVEGEQPDVVVRWAPGPFAGGSGVLQPDADPLRVRQRAGGDRDEQDRRLVVAQARADRSCHRADPAGPPRLLMRPPLVSSFVPVTGDYLEAVFGLAS